MFVTTSASKSQPEKSSAKNIDLFIDHVHFQLNQIGFSQ